MKNEIAIAVQAGVPAIVWGMPGGGKTSFFYNIAKTLDWPIRVVIASIHDPSDFSGLPIPEDHHVWFAPPDWAKDLSTVEKGILFFDEISCFPAGTMITLSDGTEKPIEKLTEGDSVIGYDLKTGQACINLVLTTRRQHANKLIKIKLADGREIRATKDHKIFTEDGWKEAGHIQVGDGLLSLVQDDSPSNNKHSP